MAEFARYPSLEGRVVYVSGGAQGIGAEIVRVFAEQGAKVGFLDRDEAASTGLVEQLDGTHVRHYERILKRYGRAVTPVAP